MSDVFSPIRNAGSCKGAQRAKGGRGNVFSDLISIPQASIQNIRRTGKQYTGAEYCSPV